MNFFDIDNTMIHVLGYPLSYLEFLGWISGIAAVALSARANIWSWPLGLINVTLSFFLYFQVQLYPDMFLQVFFFVTNVAGWWRWANPAKEEEDRKHELKVSFMKRSQLVLTLGIGIIGTIVMALLASNLHELLPSVFSQPSAAPFLDSFITVISIVATFAMIQKKVECWIMWLLVDIVATYVYWVRDIKFYSLLYFIFCVLASYALYNWSKEYRDYQRDATA